MPIPEDEKTVLEKETAALEAANKLLDKQVAKCLEQQVEAQLAAPSQRVETRLSRSQHKQATARAYQLESKLKPQRQRVCQ